MRRHESGLTTGLRHRPFRFASVLSLGLLGFALSPIGCVGRIDDEGGPDGSESGGSGPASGASSGTGAGGKPATGGVIDFGGLGGGSPSGGSPSGGNSAGGAAGEPGSGGQGGEMSICELPFDGGPCDAAIPVYSHNVQTGLCEPTVYGGCGGNENRFETLAACEQACGVERNGRACEVNGVTYPSGSTVVPHPGSCNTCLCTDGELTACTGLPCPDTCPEGTLAGTECAECGPTDACLTVRTACLPKCESQDECEGGFCSEGVCRRGICG